MNFIRCKQPDNDFQPVLDFVAQEGLAVIDSIIIENVPVGSKCRVSGHGYKEYCVVDDGLLEITFEYAGHYEILITGTDYKERIYCEVAPFNAV